MPILTNLLHRLWRRCVFRGYEAVKEYSLQFDQAEPYEISQEELEAATRRIDPALYASLRRSAENIRVYQQELLTKTRCGRAKYRGG